MEEGQLERVGEQVKRGGMYSHSEETRVLVEKRRRRIARWERRRGGIGIGRLIIVEMFFA